MLAPQAQPQPTVLVIDDVPENLLVVSELLREDGYVVRVARSGPAGLRHAKLVPQPDLILLDVMMPQMDGYEVLRRLRADPETVEIPVIFVTASGEESDEEHGLALGAVDFLRKPIRPLVTLARVRAQIQARQARRAMAHANRTLAGEVGDRIRELHAARRVAIRALAHLAEQRDPETGNHILRTQGYVQELALALRDEPGYAEQLDDRMVDWMAESAPLHDIGKVGIPDNILLKPGPLTPDEWVVMRTHTTIGARAIELAERDMDEPTDFLRIAHQIAQSHHERWDGKGYPQGLSGTEIPLAARIMAVADVFDALISPRVYKKPMPIGDAWRIIVADSGTRFDPAVVRSFERAFDRLVAISRQHEDKALELVA
ncbi:MAG: response regulator [Rubrivivax sp.]|jgi:putative two-component system response regulator|nr:response regulator [Rubrivivax sp.]